MARRRTNESIDWYLISVDRLKQIGGLVFIALLALAGWWFTQRINANPKSQAQSALAAARQALNSLASSKDLAAHRTDLERAQSKYDEAANLFGGGKFAEAQSAAVESQTISRTALSGASEENDARFLTVDGDVQYQKSSSSEWKRADLRSPLVNGDWVKTGDNASAELMFQNGSLYTIGPNALLEIYSAVAPGTSRKTNAVQMQVGSVEVATVSAGSTVRTPGTQVVVDSESTTQVGIDQDKTTSVVTMRGSASVAPPAGGSSVKLEAGQKVVASNAGAISAISKVVMPPALVSPADNQVFNSAEREIRFEWQTQQGATAYQLQVSRSRLFSAPEINARRTKTTADAKTSSEGTFYWRVASIATDGSSGPFSPFRRFRVSGGTKSAAASTGDTTPPPLTLQAPFNIGGQFYMIEGTTEPGATVFINDQDAEVDSNGHFKMLVTFNKVGPNAVVVKAVDAAGNQTVQSQTVMVEE